MKSFRPSALVLWVLTLFAATLIGFLAFNRTGARVKRGSEARSQTRNQVHQANQTQAIAAQAPAASQSLNPVARAPEATRATQPTLDRRPRNRWSSARTLVVGAVVASLLSVAVIAPVLAAPDVSSCTPALNCTIEEWTDERNHEAYWEKRFGMDCTKVNSADMPVHLETGVAILVIKAGNSNAIWQPAPAGNYSTDKETSHWFYCGEETVEDDVIDPRGSIRGPCSDPAYYGVFDNSLSTVPITFRFRWYTWSGLHAKLKTVPAGMTYTTWQHWAKPNTYVSVFYKNPDTGNWTLLARQLTKRGNWPVCVYTPGWSAPV